jgi:hypothetical protein
VAPTAATGGGIEELELFNEGPEEEIKQGRVVLIASKEL